MALKKKKKTVVIVCSGIIFMLCLFVIFGIDNSTEVTYYQIYSNKIDDTVTMAFVSDLHSCDYGERSEELCRLVDEQKPDIVLLGGDFFDDELDDVSAVAFLEHVAPRYPTFYASGNHEYWSGRIREMKKQVQQSGGTVLEGDGKTLFIHGVPLTICGVDDPTYIKNDSLRKQLTSAARNCNAETFSILLSHRPELTDIYQQYDYDLVLAGHAHGGQWRIPHVLPQGIYSPNEKFFPKYTCGDFPLGNGRMIVSRGLSKESTRLPRLYNRPELVVVKLLPQKSRK